MTMDGMVEYLEKKGFGVSKTYDPKKRVYRFAIAKDNATLIKEFTYPYWFDLPEDVAQEHLYMKNWLDDFIEEFKRKTTKFTTATQAGTDYCKHDAESAKEFLKRINEIANSTEQKLSGDLTNGYTYITTSDLTLEHAYHRFLCNEIINKFNDEKGKENMATSSITMNIVSNGVNANKTNYSSMFGYNSRFEIKDVIFNDPATIVFWKDGSKTVVKADNELYDPEKGLAMAIAKKAYGNKGNYFNEIKKWTGDTRLGDPMKDPDVIDFVKEANRMLLNRCDKNWTKEMLITDAKTALKDISCAIGICVDKYHVSAPYDIWFAQKVLYEALTDAYRRKATVVSAMERAATFLVGIIGE